MLIDDTRMFQPLNRTTLTPSRMSTHRCARLVNLLDVAGLQRAGTLAAGVYCMGTQCWLSNSDFSFPDFF